jgi:hypothetical protein
MNLTSVRHMKRWARLTPLEKASVVFGVILVIMGLYGLASPHEETIDHPRENRFGRLLGPEFPAERVSIKRWRAYSVGSVVFGCCIVFVAVYGHGRPSQNR